MAPYPPSAYTLGAGPVLAPKDMDLVALEASARGALGEMAYAYYSGGAEEGRLLTENTSAWQRYHLVPKVLVDVSEISTTTTVLGEEVMVPVIIAPTAVQRLASLEGEAGAVGEHEIGTVRIKIARPVAVELFSMVPSLGRFILEDPRAGIVLAAGVIHSFSS